MDAQLKKGLLDLVVLAVLKNDDSYGYKIIQDVSRLIELSESTLYPILKRLDEQGLVTTYSTEYQSRLRKYYRITPQGRTKLKESETDFQEVKRIYDFILR
jgi:PadR family transcriptional regulator PadR